MIFYLAQCRAFYIYVKTYLYIFFVIYFIIYIYTYLEIYNYVIHIDSNKSFLFAWETNTFLPRHALGVIASPGTTVASLGCLVGRKRSLEQ